MALQIKKRIASNASHEELIEQINRFIFQEMGFRFPPHAIHVKDIDLYTFLGGMRPRQEDKSMPMFIPGNLLPRHLHRHRGLYFYGNLKLGGFA
jgi:hypothetical protein